LADVSGGGKGWRKSRRVHVTKLFKRALVNQ
jgi:hypothetical protein